MVTGDDFPEEKLPQCWSDDVRMNALFAPFRLKSANPESWDMKMKFWSNMVRQWCKYKMNPIVSAADVRCVFQRRGRTSACIEIVIEEMFRNGELSPITKYQQILHKGPEGWVKWGARLAFRPASFALTFVTSLLPANQATDANGLPKANIDSTQRFVLESALKEQAMDLLNNFPPGAERIGTIEELMRSSGHSNREVYEIHLGYLVSQGMAIKQGDVVKLAEPNKKVTPVTELDTALVKLMSTATRLSGDTERLSREVEIADVEVRAALKLGNKLVAKSHLRKKHKAQQRLGRCEAALENIRELIQQAKNTDVNTAVVDTYKTSAQAMKSTMKDGGLDEDSVYDTMDNLKEVMDSYNEVEKALGGTLEDLDMTELEQELNDLLAGSGNTGGTPGKEERTRIVTKLPSPPSETPEKSDLRPEKDYVFDGEEQMLADLNKLDETYNKVAMAEALAATDPHSPNKPEQKGMPSQVWSLPSSSNESVSDTWSNKLNRLAQDYGELRKDNRLHPGQQLDLDFSTPPQHYSADFLVRDHKAANGVWLFNSKDTETLASSTEYPSTCSPEQSTSSKFEMAPGGERKKPDPWPKDDYIEDLENRLKNLKGF